MKNILTTKSFFSLLVAALAFSSCKKEIPVKPTKQDNQKVFNQTAKLSNSAQKFAQIVLAKHGFKTFAKVPDLSHITPCAVITYDTLAYPHTITIDFTSGCVDDQGIFQQGIVTLSYNMDFDFLDEAGLSLQIEYQNFSADDTTRLDAALNFNNFGTNGSGNTHGSMVVSFTMRELNGSGRIVNGNYTQNFEVFPSYIEMTGGMTASDNLGNTIQHVPLTPLRQGNSSGCNEVYVQGMVEVYENSALQYTIDYGDGSCNTDAIKTFPDGTRQVVLAGEDVQ